MTDSCAVCGKTIDFVTESPILHDACDHYTCAGTCSDGSSATCPPCEQRIATASQRKQHQAAARPLVVVQSHQSRGLFGGILAKANYLSSGIRNRHETAESSTDPFWLVKKGPAAAPVASLIEKGLDFNTCVQHGLTLDHFLEGGYTIGDLAEFPEVSAEISTDGVTPIGVKAMKRSRCERRT